MHDEVIGRVQVLGEVRMTIPPRVVGWLRRGVYAEIGLAAEALDRVAFARDREAHPEWFRGPAESLRETYALLDAIGWSGTVPPPAVEIDLREDYCWTLMRALAAAVEFADEDVCELGREVEHTEQGSMPECEVGVECVGALCDFMEMAQARIDALAVQEGAGAVLDIAA